MAISKFIVPMLVFSAACAFASFPTELRAQQPSARQVAALVEEITALRDEVNRLRMDVEDLRSENARLLEKKASGKNAAAGIDAEIAALRVEFSGKIETLRRELLAEIDKRISRSNADVNAALKEMRRQVNEALDGKSTNAGTPSTPVAEPKDLPQNGIRYKIRPGDTITKIAKENRSKTNWILYANPGLNPNRIIPGKEILIPQND